MTRAPAGTADCHPGPVRADLDEGTRCDGGARRADGYEGAYSCSGTDAHLAVLWLPSQGAGSCIDRASPAWTVKIGQLGTPAHPASAPDPPGDGSVACRRQGRSVGRRRYCYNARMSGQAHAITHVSDTARGDASHRHGTARLDALFRDPLALAGEHGRAIVDNVPGTTRNGWWRSPGPRSSMTPSGTPSPTATGC